MGSGKLSISETSSEEIDQPAKLMISDDNAGIGRSYECTFCKRGFTNAQALGGHMNIHRKDKAKAKQKNHLHHQKEYQSSNKSLDDYHPSSNYFAPNLHDHHHHHQRQYSTAMAAYMSYQLYCPASNDGYIRAYNNQYDMASPRSGHHHRLSMHDFHMDQGLSLSISPPSLMADGDERKMGRNDGEVDLELRLGYYP